MSFRRPCAIHELLVNDYLPLGVSYTWSVDFGSLFDWAFPYEGVAPGGWRNGGREWDEWILRLGPVGSLPGEPLPPFERSHQREQEVALGHLPVAPQDLETETQNGSRDEPSLLPVGERRSEARPLRPWVESHLPPV